MVWTDWPSPIWMSSIQKKLKINFLFFDKTLCVDDGKELYFEFESKVLLWYFHLNKVALKIVLGSDFKI